MRRYFLRLLNGGGWELYDSGHLVSKGVKWTHAVATHVRILMLSREGQHALPIIESGSSDIHEAA